VKLNRLITAGVAVALVASSSLLVAGAANAADSYITASQFGAEGASYPAGWFTGAGSTGSITTTPSGLSITARMQILNGTPGTSSSPDLVALATGAHIGVVSGSADFQIPLFTDGTAKTGFTTLRPDSFNNPGLNPLAGWTTSRAFGTFAAGSSHTLQDYQAQVAGFPNFQILAYGVIVPVGVSAVLSSITFNGNTTWFTPKPTGTATPSTVTVTAFQTTGVAAHLTGFVAGETVDGGFASNGSGSATGLSYTADAGGNVDFVFKTLVTPGTYTLSGNASVSGIAAFASVTVVADGTANPVATPATPVKRKADFTG
jgi:hypothetical protein